MNNVIVMHKVNSMSNLLHNLLYFFFLEQLTFFKLIVKVSSSTELKN